MGLCVTYISHPANNNVPVPAIAGALVRLPKGIGGDQLLIPVATPFLPKDGLQ